ncbi:hypothetical protein [Botrimarina mediterranea]|uniref:hypothetical protein n=1 Tax=Botrimarina mediterranea TaxID=2528022 RepID=UPI001187FE90|nr:hypothetical protein K2D_31240 [Planctomycetes bacterium K2D]
MNFNRPHFSKAILVVAGLLVTTHVHAASIDEMLANGKLAAAEKSLQEFLDATPNDALALTQLGAVKFLGAVERLGQASYRFGTGDSLMRAMPFFRLPVPPNDEPQKVGYENVREVLEQFVAELAEVEAILVKVGDRDVKWLVDIAALRMDFNADGKAEASESLGAAYRSMTRMRDEKAEEDAFVVGLDTADVYWLRGYCHVLCALGESLLAYDQQRMFDHTAQLVFPKSELKHDFLTHDTPGADERQQRSKRWQYQFADAIAMIHLVDWPLAEPERLKRAHGHLLLMVETSRDSWRSILAETDNDHEWIPGPEQQSVLPRGALSQEQIDAWQTFLDEAESLLEGEKLAPFWRESDQGVNLRRVFYEPTQLDLVLWVQGSAAAPYLEEGPKTEEETWMMLQRVFRGNFIGFAFWIN